MDKFEKQFEDLDVQTGYMEHAMGDTTTLTVPQVVMTSGLFLPSNYPIMGAMYWLAFIIWC